MQKRFQMALSHWACVASLYVMAASFSALAATETSQVRNAPKLNEKPLDYAQLKQWYSKPLSQWPAAHLDEGVSGELASPIETPASAINHAMAALGEQLFHETLLSRDQSLSCASCHEARFAFSDARRVAIGIDNQKGSRNTPPIFGVDMWESFFWDGRAKTASEQALGPIENPIEMDLPLETAMQRLNASATYRDAFARVFIAPVVGDDVAYQGQITKTQLGLAIQEFERTIRIPDTPLIRFIQQAEQLADTEGQSNHLINDFSEQQLWGMHLFRTKARCINCHNGPLLSDNQFHVTGLTFYGRKKQDLGRYNATQNPRDSGKFRTPSLWQLSVSAPWMHTGGFQTFRAVSRFYQAGGVRIRPKKDNPDDPLRPTLSPQVKPFKLTKKEELALIAFLEML